MTSTELPGPIASPEPGGDSRVVEEGPWLPLVGTAAMVVLAGGFDPGGLSLESYRGTLGGFQHPVPSCSLRGRLYNGIARRLWRLFWNLLCSTWNRFNLLPLPPTSSPFRSLFLSTSQNVIVLDERGLGHTSGFSVGPSASPGLVKSYCAIISLFVEPFAGGSLSEPISLKSTEREN